MTASMVLFYVLVLAVVICLVCLAAMVGNARSRRITNWSRLSTTGGWADQRPAHRDGEPDDPARPLTDWQVQIAAQASLRVRLRHPWWLGLAAGVSGAAAVILLVMHAWEPDSCAVRGISTPAGREGSCVRYGAFDEKTTYVVVDAGHTLRMPGFTVRLLATRMRPTRVEDPSLAPQDYPGGEGTLVSMELTVADTSARPLPFDTDGQGVWLLIDQLGGGPGDVSFPDLPDAAGEPGQSIAESVPLAPHTTRTGWVTFVAPEWVGQVLHRRAADLDITQPSAFVGQIRLWKWAGPQGAAALGVSPSLAV